MAQYAEEPDLSKDLNTLVALDELRVTSMGRSKVFIHRDHRWVLPLLHFSQTREQLPTPCNLVMFDAHHDALEPSCLDRIRRLRETGITTEGLIELCQNDLRRLDDDWLRAGMHLGLIRDAVIFGVREPGYDEFPMKFTDSAGGDHRIEIMWLPGRELGYQGALADLASHGNECAWQILGWKRQDNGLFGFSSEPKIALDFDLDCFAVPWRDYVFPWPDEVFEEEFLKVSNYFTTTGWSGQTFVRGLMRRAGLLSIAREPEHCGGAGKGAHILDRLCHYVLNSTDSSR